MKYEARASAEIGVLWFRETGHVGNGHCRKWKNEHTREMLVGLSGCFECPLENCS